MRVQAMCSRRQCSRLSAISQVINCNKGITATTTEDKTAVMGLENCWSPPKRRISGTYVSAESFNLFRYLDEQTFRYNHREGMSDGNRFNVPVRQILGKRLTFE